MLEDQQQHAELQRDAVRAAIAAGLSSGAPVAAEPLFEQLEAKYRDQLAKKPGQ